MSRDNARIAERETIVSKLQIAVAHLSRSVKEQEQAVALLDEIRIALDEVKQAGKIAGNHVPGYRPLPKAWFSRIDREVQHLEQLAKWIKQTPVTKDERALKAHGEQVNPTRKEKRNGAKENR